MNQFCDMLLFGLGRGIVLALAAALAIVEGIALDARDRSRGSWDM